MNGELGRAAYHAALFGAEARKMLIAAAIVAGFVVVAWAIEEFRLRRVEATAAGWAGFISLALAGLGALALLAVGLLEL